VGIVGVRPGGAKSDFWQAVASAAKAPVDRYVEAPPPNDPRQAQRKEPWQMTRKEFEADAVFHGTGRDNAGRIEQHGFDPNRFGLRQMLLRGGRPAPEPRGVYFTPDRDYARSLYSNAGARPDANAADRGGGAVVATRVDRTKLMPALEWQRLKRDVEAAHPELAPRHMYDTDGLQRLIDKAAAAAQRQGFIGVHEAQNEFVVFHPTTTPPLLHRRSVERAIQEGRLVPPHVRAEYNLPPLTHRVPARTVLEQAGRMAVHEEPILTRVLHGVSRFVGKGPFKAEVQRFGDIEAPPPHDTRQAPTRQVKPRKAGRPEPRPEIGRVGQVRFPWPDVQPDSGRLGFPVRFPSTASLQVTPFERGLPIQQVTLYPRGWPPPENMSPLDAWRKNPVGYGFRLYPQPGPTVFARIPGKQINRVLDQNPDARRDAALAIGGSALLGTLGARRFYQQWDPAVHRIGDYPRRVDTVDANGVLRVGDVEARLPTAQNPPQVGDWALYMDDVKRRIKNAYQAEVPPEPKPDAPVAVWRQGPTGKPVFMGYEGGNPGLIRNLLQRKPATGPPTSLLQRVGSLLRRSPVKADVEAPLPFDTRPKPKPLIKRGKTGYQIGDKIRIRNPNIGVTGIPQTSISAPGTVGLRFSPLAPHIYGGWYPWQGSPAHVGVRFYPTPAIQVAPRTEVDFINNWIDQQPNRKEIDRAVVGAGAVAATGLMAHRLKKEKEARFTRHYPRRYDWEVYAPPPGTSGSPYADQLLGPPVPVGDPVPEHLRLERGRLFDRPPTPAASTDWEWLGRSYLDRLKQAWEKEVPPGSPKPSKARAVAVWRVPYGQPAVPVGYEAPPNAPPGFRVPKPPPNAFRATPPEPLLARVAGLLRRAGGVKAEQPRILSARQAYLADEAARAARRQQLARVGQAAGGVARGLGRVLSSRPVHAGLGALQFAVGYQDAMHGGDYRDWISPLGPYGPVPGLNLPANALPKIPYPGHLAVARAISRNLGAAGRMNMFASPSPVPRTSLASPTRAALLATKAAVQRMGDVIAPAPYDTRERVPVRQVLAQGKDPMRDARRQNVDIYAGSLGFMLYPALSRTTKRMALIGDQRRAEQGRQIEDLIRRRVSGQPLDDLLRHASQPAGYLDPRRKENRFVGGPVDMVRRQVPYHPALRDLPPATVRPKPGILARTRGVARATGALADHILDPPWRPGSLASNLDAANWVPGYPSHVPLGAAARIAKPPPPSLLSRAAEVLRLAPRALKSDLGPHGFDWDPHDATAYKDMSTTSQEALVVRGRGVRPIRRKRRHDDHDCYGGMKAENPEYRRLRQELHDVTGRLNNNYAKENTAAGRRLPTRAYSPETQQLRAEWEALVAKVKETAQHFPDAVPDEPVNRPHQLIEPRSIFSGQSRRSRLGPPGPTATPEQIERGRLEAEARYRALRNQEQPPESYFTRQSDPPHGPTAARPTQAAPRYHLMADGNIVDSRTGEVMGAVKPGETPPPPDTHVGPGGRLINPALEPEDYRKLPLGDPRRTQGTAGWVRRGRVLPRTDDSRYTMGAAPGSRTRTAQPNAPATTGGRATPPAVERTLPPEAFPARVPVAELERTIPPTAQPSAAQAILRGVVRFLRSGAKASDRDYFDVLRLRHGPSFDLQRSPNTVFRGLTAAEAASIVTHGKIRSTGRFSHPSEGTSFAPQFGIAESTVNFGRDNPGRTGHPTFVVEVAQGPDIQVDPRDGFPKAKNAIPSGRIVRSWRFDPDGTVFNAPRTDALSLAPPGRVPVRVPVSRVLQETAGPLMQEGPALTRILRGAARLLNNPFKAELTARMRNRLPDSAFALPGRRYPVHDPAHCRAALQMVARFGSSDEKRRVRLAVAQRCHGMGGAR